MRFSLTKRLNFLRKIVLEVGLLAVPSELSSRVINNQSCIFSNSVIIKTRCDNT